MSCKHKGKRKWKNFTQVDEDETGCQYISDNEGPTIPLDEDEDTDG